MSRRFMEFVKSGFAWDDVMLDLQWLFRQPKSGAVSPPDYFAFFEAMFKRLSLENLRFIQQLLACELGSRTKK